MMSKEAYVSAQDMLKRCGMDPTLNRILVLSVLAGSDHPMTVKDVFEHVRHEHKLNRVTVYRILDLFADRGVVNKISSGERSFCYCARPGRWPHGHCHFHCICCGEVRCLDQNLVVIDEVELRKRLPMDIHSIELRLDGVCAACREKGKT